MVNVMIDIDKLKSISSDSKTSEAVFKYLFDRQRGRADTNLRRVHRIMQESGTRVPYIEIGDVFRKLQDIGLGKLVFGRKGNPTRFIWNFNLRSIKDVLEGKALSLKKQLPAVKKLNLPKLQVATANPTSEAIKFTRDSNGSIKIKKGSTVLEIPVDLTEEEAKKVAALLSLLPDK